MRHFRTRSYEYEIPIKILLQKGRNREVTDPIDKIYGILGLMPEYIQEAMTVDNTLPPTQVYVLFSKLWSQTDSMLSMLSLVDGPNQAVGLPSWCPNYNSPRMTSDLGGQMGLLSGYHAGFWSPWRPRKVMRIEPWTNVMRIKALKVDEISHVVKSERRLSFYGRTNAAKSLRWEKTCLSVAQMCLEESSSPIPLPYLRTLVADRAPLTSINSPDASKPDYYTAYAEAMTVLEKYAQGQDSMAEGAAREFCNGILQVCQSRSFLATRDHRVGIGPTGSQVGDFVCIFENSCIAFIVRSFGGGDCSLVGETYVDGLMYGEAMEMNDRGIVEFEEICIV